MGTIYSRLKLILSFAVFYLISASGIAQGTLTGTIDDGQEALIGANILIQGTGSGTVTDFDGNYSLRLPVGEQTILITYTGYSPMEYTLLVEQGKTYTQNFTLQTDKLSLDEVVVTATFGSRSQKDSPISMTYLNAGQLQKLASNSQADILRTIPGITAEGGGGEVASNVFVRGMRGNIKSIYSIIQNT